jgi:hypothetical protein
MIHTRHASPHWRLYMTARTRAGEGLKAIHVHLRILDEGFSTLLQTQVREDDLDQLVANHDIAMRPHLHHLSPPQYLLA